MNSLWKSFSRLFDDLSYDLFGESLKFPTPSFKLDWGMTHDRKDDSFVTTVDLPGFEEQDIKVELTPDGHVSVKAVKSTKDSHTSVTKYFSVPLDCSSDGLVADFKDGKLTLTMPVQALPAAKEVKQIPLNTSR